MTNFRRAVENIKVIQNIDSSEYPNLHKLLHKRRGGLYQALIYILEKSDREPYLQYEEYGAGSFSQSIGHFTRDEEARAINRTTQTWQNKLILLLAIGLIKRDKPDENTTNLNKRLAVSRSIRMQHKNKRKAQPISYWYFDKYTDKKIVFCERRSKKWVDSGYSLSNISKEVIIKVYGEKIANAIYQDKRRISAITNIANYEIANAISEIVQLKGYAYRDEVLTLAGRQLFNKLDVKPDTISQQKALNKAMNKVRKEWNKQRQEVIDIGGYQYSRPREADKTKYNITGNEWIITKIAEQNITI